MRVERIETSTSCWTEDPRLSDYRMVRDSDRVRRSEAFLVEGRQIVRTLLTEAPLRAQSLLVTESALAWIEREVEEVPADLPVYVVSAAAMRDLSGFRFHQGCLAAGRRPEPVAAGTLLENPDPRPNLVVGLERVTNPDNVGAIFRSSAAFGVDALLLSPECASPLYRKAIRTSMGAALKLPYAHGDAWGDSLAALRSAGFILLALTTRGETESIDDVVRALPRDPRIALLLGAEGTGLGPESLAAADQRVVIPMSAGMDCLNVAAAAVVALYCVSAAPRRR